MSQDLKAKPNKKSFILRGLVLFFAGSFILCFTPVSLIFAQDPDITITTNTTWEAGSYTYNNVLITNGAILTLNGTVTINTQTLTIDSASSLSASGKGYPATQGPGTGTIGTGGYGGGAGYGGNGSNGYCNYGLGGSSYGFITQPLELGSGGAASVGGAGGGAIRLNVTGTLTLNGTISSNGADGKPYGFYGGGGSGGSIYIEAGSLTGNGNILANGGKGSTGAWNDGPYGGGGGGGRIAIYYGSSEFNGLIQAIGGKGDSQKYGGAGTIFIKSSNQRVGDLIIDNNNNSGVTTQATETEYNFDNLKILNKASAILPGNITSSNIILRNGAALGTLNNNLKIISGLISIESSSKLQGNLAITVNNLTIDSTSILSADARGYLLNQGPGAGATGMAGYGGGAGYGGKGSSAYHDVAGGTTYGSSSQPIDLGSGGGSSVGGTGGGAIKLSVLGNLTINGAISANGQDGKLHGYYGGGGSGGSLYIIASNLTGSGTISSNGGKGSTVWTDTDVTGGGGGGGRVAVYYSSSYFSGKVEAKGGAGWQNIAESGTVVFQGASEDSPITSFNLIEKSSTTSTLSETLSTQLISLNNVTVSGDLSGALNFTNLEIIKIETGSFTGKGFSKGEFEANLEGITYGGSFSGITYFIPQDNKIYLKGELSGDINGICNGCLSETIPQSGNYDKYQAIWKLNRLGTETVSVTSNLEGTLSYQTPHSFNSQLYLYQANMEGGAFGYYAGPLSAVVTHLRLTDENEYKGQGFSIVSYTSSLGQGEAYSYNRLFSDGKVDFYGLFEAPILGKLSALLDEAVSPKTLSGIIERMDLSLEPMADLEVVIWGPQRVSPGQTVSYIIEIRNDGVKSAENTAILFDLDPLLEYISSTYSYHNEETNEISMDLGTLEAKGKKIIRVTAKAPWGLGPHTPLENSCRVTTTTKEKDLSKIDTACWREDIQPGDIILEHNAHSPVWTRLKSYWTHTGGIAYGTKDDSWTSFREGYFVIEPLPNDYREGINRGGVRVTPIESWDFPFKKELVVLRVEGLTLQQKDYITNFWENQIGKPYQDWLKYLNKDPNIEASEWYCSELMWAPYYNLGINIDSAEYLSAIAPQEIYDSNFTSSVPGAYYNLDVYIYKYYSEIITANDPNEILVSPEGDVRPGTELTYTINYENIGEGIAFGVYITDTLEEDLDASTIVINNGGSYDPDTRTLNWFIGEAGPAQEGSVSFKVKVKTDALDKSEVINFATIYFPSVPQATRTNGVVNRINTTIDNVPPTTIVTPSPLPNQNGWNNSTVTINLTAVDNEGGSGIAKAEYSLDETNWVTYTAPFTIINEGLTKAYYRSTDNTGNVEEVKSFEIKIDKTSPEVSINTPAQGAEYVLNAQILANWQAADSLSGIASSTGTVLSGSAIDTSSVGPKNFNVASTDKAGNTIEQSLTYNVRYTYAGVLPPINQDDSSIFKLGRVVPVKFQLKDAAGNYISTAAARIYLSKISNTVLGGEIEAESVGSANTGNLFRYDSAENQYIFNLGTSNLSKGTWQIKIQLDDGSLRYVSVSFK
ncbi:MAG: PxKF domain-containing protein [Candidatus Omnitrophota bacterium]